MIDVIGLIEYNVYRSSKKKRKADKKLENYQSSGTRNRHEKNGVKSERVEESTMRKIV
jgi:hypothetical protein